MLTKINKILNKLINEENKSKITEKKIQELSSIVKIAKEITEYQVSLNNEKELKEIYLAEIENLTHKMQNEFEIYKNKQLQQQESIMLEIRSGEGGQEAELFALELFEMYQKVAKKMNWKFIIFEILWKESGGIKECTCEISGKGIVIWLNQESGVHCVKRVPKTEKKGRIHTSTATIAILKQPNEIEVQINEKDLRIDVFRSSGPGGQSVNTTDSAVRILHIPTGIVVSQQDEKSQLKNKEKALKILKARIFAKQQQEEHEKNEQERRNAIGTAKRNERIRTYHFTQNWVNDSRIELKCHNIIKFMEGDELITFLNELILNSL